MAFICPLSSGFSTSSIVASISLYLFLMISRLPRCTRNFSARAYRSAATSGMSLPWTTKYLTSESSLTSSGSKLTESSPDRLSRVRRGRVSFSVEVASTVSPHLPYSSASKSVRPEEMLS